MWQFLSLYSHHPILFYSFTARLPEPQSTPSSPQSTSHSISQAQHPGFSLLFIMIGLTRVTCVWPCYYSHIAEYAFPIQMLSGFGFYDQTSAAAAASSSSSFFLFFSFSVGNWTWGLTHARLVPFLWALSSARSVWFAFNKSLKLIIFLYLV